MTAMILAERLEKRYGPRWAVRGVSFSIEEGEVVGLLGPNGSGKSTILRMLTGYLVPSAGSARVDGLDVVEDSIAVRKRIGYVPEDAPLYDDMRVGEFLRFMAQLKGLSGRAVDAAVLDVRGALRLEGVLHMPIGKISRGYRQRVAIAQALVAKPKVLILDEPTNALDAYQVIAVRDVIRSLAGRCTVIVASHVLTEIEKVASRVMILVDGRLLTADAMRDVAMARRFRLKAAGDVAAVLAGLREVPGVSSAEADGALDGELHTYLVQTTPSPRMGERLARRVLERGFELAELAEIKPDLEGVFLDLTRGAAEAA